MARGFFILKKPHPEKGNAAFFIPEYMRKTGDSIWNETVHRSFSRH